MKFEELIVLLPCHSLEDFPVHPEGTEAEGLLAAWSALWHPALIASAGRMPGWFRADGPPDTLANRLLVIPQSSESLLLAGWASRAKTEGAHVVRKLHRRAEIVAAALAELDGGDGGVHADLAADFLALGYCFLAVELLTRQMRYMSNLDEVHLQNEVVAAAQAAMIGDELSARRQLKTCFETLLEARERFYPVEAFLVDLTLVASSTLGERLRQELSAEGPRNLLLSGQVLEQMAKGQPETLAVLRSALERRLVSVAGGEYIERELPLMPVESIRRELLRGAAVYQDILGASPAVFGRRRFGLAPVLPQILTRLGYQGALHLTLEDGQFPQSAQCKTRWEGLDGSALDALSCLPVDASRPESFLSFPRHMGETMDRDHVATLLLAHWPGQACDFYEDLRRMSSYAPALGKFITLDDYFQNTNRPGDLTRFKADQYRSPYLRQAIIREESEPLTRLAGHHRRALAAESEQAIATVATLLGNGSMAERADFLGELERLASSSETTTVQLSSFDQQLTAQAEATARRLRDNLFRAGTAAERGYLIFNAQSFTRQVGIDVSSLSAPPEVKGPVMSVQDAGGKKLAVVELPGMGYAWIGPGPAAAKSKPPKGTKPLAEGTILRNEFMEVTIHPNTGGVRSVYVPGQRGNRLSEQLALRLPSPRPKPGDVWRDPDEDANYSVMACDGVEVTSAGPALGEIETRGRLLDREGKKLAGFVQRFQLWRGSRVMGLEIELDLIEPLRAEPWNSYVAARFAWGDTAAELSRSVSLTRQPTTAKRLEAPHFIEIRSDKLRTTLLTGGLPYHRMTGDRMLDTLLVVRGDSTRKFRLGVGLELAHPALQAIDLMDPVILLPETPAPPEAQRVGWLFHVDAKNVVATHWEPHSVAPDGNGFRVRLLETEGRPGRVHLRAFRPLKSARQIDFKGQTLVGLPIEGDRVSLDLAAYEWAEVEVV